MKTHYINNSQFGKTLLSKISDYFCQLTKKDNALICPKHKVEHVGKNAYSIIIDLKLYELTGEEKYYERAKTRAQRTVQKLIQDPKFGDWVFFPGRVSRWNMSGSVIDSGTCLDALSAFYLACRDKLDGNEKKEIEETIFKNGHTYLVAAVVQKEVTNQRLWGGTGLASAYRVFREEKWRQNLLESIEKSLGEMWPDGTFAYHSYWQEYKIYKGIYDTTTFYHSRCISFIYYILENLGENLDRYKEKLIKAGDLLVAMYQPNGVKNINLECKRWYWHSPYEIASSAFDIYALVKIYKLTKNRIYAYYAKKAFEQVLKHQIKDGGITSHLLEPQNNFQCRIFWNSNLAWLVRVIEEIAFLPGDSEREELRYFKDSGILKFRNENYGCILRGRKQPMSLMWGPAIGGGSLLYFGNSRENSWENNLNLEPWQESIPGNFSFYAKENYFKNLKRFIIENKTEIRGKLFHAATELRSPNFKSFLALLLKLFKMILSGGKGVYTSHWATDPAVKEEAGRIIFEIVPAKRNGQTLEGVKIKREYIFKDDALYIKENLFIKNKGNIKIKYKKIPNSRDFKIITADMRCEENYQKILCYPEPGSRLEFSYSLI